MKRVTFYIDGFNFYFGIKRARKANPAWNMSYWIDLVKLCSFFLGDNQSLEKVVYFTASPLSPAKFTDSIMPDEVSDGTKTYTVPDKWKNF